MATLVVSGLDRDVSMTLSLDGSPVEDTGERPFRLDVNPGARSLQVSQEGFLPFRWQEEVEPGSEMRIAVGLLPMEVAEESPSFTSRPAFWIVLGVVALAAGGTAWYFLDQGAQLEPNDPTRPQIMLLSSP